MRILVTGGAGFIGSHVADAYVEAGHEVWVLDDLSRGKREQVNPRVQFVRMDLRSPELRAFIADGKFDCVNHHAAQIDVRISVADPARDASVNIGGLLNLLESMRHHRVPMLIFASTGGAIYGEQERFPAPESHAARPVSPYGVAKLSAEHYLDYYAQVHGLRHMVLRYANVYGPRQDPEGEAGVVAIFCARVLKRQKLIIYGDGDQTRDYVYVKDVARANILALEKLLGPAYPAGSNRSHIEEASDSLGSAGSTHSALPLTNEPSCVFNIGTGIETSVNALAAMLLEAADVDCHVVHQPCRAGEQRRSAIDSSRAARVLGWTPSHSLQAGLRETLAWFQARVDAPVGASCGRLRS